MLRKLSFLLLCTLSICLPAGAATLLVGPGQPYTTIQAAINAASAGDTVLVSPGTYYENIDFLGKAITVTSVAGPATTILDGGAKTGAATVQFTHGETRTSVISRMTIRNGGSGINSVAAEASGGVYAYQSAPSILDNIITANLCAGVINDIASALIQGNTISGTIGAVNGDCILEKGQAILVFGYSLKFGSGIVPTILGNLIQNNVQGIYGSTGGVNLWSGDNAVIQNNTFTGNTGTEAGAIASANTNKVAILQNLFYGNSGGGAGAIYLLPPDASVGPFIGILAGNTIAQNTVTYPKSYSGDTPASQVYLSGNLGQYLLVNNIIVGNAAGTAAVNCDVGYNYLSITPVVFDHNDIVPGQGVAYAGSCADQTGTYGNLGADPLFTNPASGDFRLLPGSPARDAGNNSAPLTQTTDLAGNSRILDSTAKGFPVIDMGAYESAGVSALPPTVLTLTPSRYFDQLGYLLDKTPLVFTIQLTSAAGTPGGPVTLYQDNAVLTVVNIGPSGTATYSGGVAPGLHAYTATYAGSPVFSPAVSVKFFLLNPLTPSTLQLTSTPNPSLLGSPVTFTLQASSPDGSIPTPVVLKNVFTNATLATLSPNAAGTATFTTSALPAGYNNLSATYAGDATHSPESVSLTQVVTNANLTTTALVCYPTPLPASAVAILTASVSAAGTIPTGTIVFADNGAFLSQAALNGSGNASFSYTAQTSGTHTLTATYTPTGSFAASTGSCSLVVTDKPSSTTLTSSLNPSSAGQPVTFSAFVTYAGGSSNLAGPAFYTFSDGATPLATIPLGGISSSGPFVAIYTSALAAGSHTITATLNPQTGYAGSSASLTQIVNALLPTALLSVTPATAAAGAPVTFTALVTATRAAAPSPTGSVAFSSNGVPLGLPGIVLNGVASLSTSALSPGTNLISCNYSGDTIYAATPCNTIPVLIRAGVTTLSLAATTNPIPALVPVTFSAHLASSAPVPAGSLIQFTLSSPGRPPLQAPIATDANGNATYTTAALAPGTYAVSAAFASTGSLLGSSTSLTETVTAIATATSLTSSSPTLDQFQTLTLSAALTFSGTGAPSGTVTFLDGATVVGAVPIQAGRATLSLNNLAPGTHLLTAAYSGDVDYVSSASSILTQTILQSDFVLFANPTHITLATGHHTTFSLSATSTGAFADQLFLSTLTLPGHVTVRIDQATPNLAPGGQTSTSLYLDTDDVLGYLSNAQPVPRRPASALQALSVAALLPALLLCSGRRRRRLPTLLACLLLGFTLFAAAGCSGKYPASAAPGSYTLQVTATGRQTHLTHTLDIPLTITP